MRPLLNPATLFLFTGVLLASGCLFESEDSPRRSPTTSIVRPNGSEDLPELIFRADGTKAREGTLKPGTQARLRVDPDRFIECPRPLSEGFRVLAYVRGVGGPWTEHLVASIEGGAMIVREPEFRVPAAARIELRLYASSGPDCAEEDPKEGDPYSFPVVVPTSGATIEFKATGDPLLIGELGPGRMVTVVYPIERLPTCRDPGDGTPGWDVEVIWRVNQITSSVALTAIEEPGVRMETPAGIDIPVNGADLQLRFRNWDQSGCEVFEPSNGESFRFAFDSP